MADQSQTTLRILRMPQMVDKVGLRRSAIYDRIDPKSPRYDPSFPKPVQLGDGGRAIGFIDAEAESWIAAQIKRSRNAS